VRALLEVVKKGVIASEARQSLATDETLQDSGHGVLSSGVQKAVIASEARQSMDHHVTSLLAMTG
jgi:hypothetical protein